MAKKEKIYPNNLERECFSNFVIDLRSAVRPAAREISMKKADKRHFWSSKSKKIEIVAPKIRPNMLRADASDAAALRSSELQPRWTWPKFTFRLSFKKKLPENQSGLTRFFSRHPRPQAATLKKSLDNHWIKLIREKENIFSTVPRPHQPPTFRLWPKSWRRPAATPATAPAAERELWYHSLFFFCLVLLVIILAVKILSQSPWRDFSAWEGQITGRSTMALNNLVAATDFATHLNFKKADSNFQAASANFLAASADLNQINGSLLTLAALSGNPKIKLAAESQKFLKAGVLASELGRDLLLATDSLFSGAKTNFSWTLDNFLGYGHAAVQEAQGLKQTMSQINLSNLPTEYRAQFLSLQNQAALLSDNLANFVSAGDQLKEIFGLSRDKRYLLVFQNNSEMRASGGFLGSYALIDLSEGKITNLEVPGGGSYDTEGAMTVRVAAPQPLWLVNPLWHFWDANWWPDWPTTAQNLMWFYSKSGGPSVDGVIGVTPTVVERLLEITGPIDLTQEYGLTITADNFWSTVETITEQKNLAKTYPQAIVGLPTSSAPMVSSLPLQQGLNSNPGNKPKKIIGDLMAKILEILPQKLNKDNLLQLITQFEADMSEKQILFYFTDPQLEAAVASRNWAGEVQASAKDYLMVINSNIAGQKSDRLMTEKIAENSVVNNDGSIINTLQITRTHTGAKNVPLTGVRNVDWLRVYVPLDSELLAASGFTSPDPQYLQARPDPSWDNSPFLANEQVAAVDPSSGTKIYQEDGKTVFANWVMADPGQSVVITLQYRLPFNFWTPAGNGWLNKINSWLNPNFTPPQAYSLLVQKQAGASPSTFNSQLTLPASWRIFWRYPETLSGADGWTISDQLTADKYYAILLEKTTNP